MLLLLYCGLQPPLPSVSQSTFNRPSILQSQPPLQYVRVSMCVLCVHPPTAAASLKRKRGAFDRNHPTPCSFSSCLFFSSSYTASDLTSSLVCYLILFMSDGIFLCVVYLNKVRRCCSYTRRPFLSPWRRHHGGNPARQPKRSILLFFQILLLLLLLLLLNCCCWKCDSLGRLLTTPFLYLFNSSALLSCARYAASNTRKTEWPSGELVSRRERDGNQSTI